MGWIFYKPTYERMKLIERDDLDRDPGVLFARFDQHRLIKNSCAIPTRVLRCAPVLSRALDQSLTRNPVPIALTVGFAFPPIFGCLWGDPIGSLVWAGIVSRLFSTSRIGSSTDFDVIKRYRSLALHIPGEFVSVLSMTLFAFFSR